MLIDFDMATVVESDDGHPSYGASSKHRTGTLPFMAYDLVLDAWRGANKPGEWKPIRHLLRHDYESLFYLAYWIVTAIKPKKAKDDPLRDLLVSLAKGLEVGGLLDLGTKKKYYCITPLDSACLDLPAETSGVLSEWFTGWTELLSDAVHAKDKHEMHCLDAAKGRRGPPPFFDMETCNGIFTRDTLQEALRPRIPEISKYTATHGHAFRPRLDFDPSPPSTHPPLDDTSPVEHAGDLLKPTTKKQGSKKSKNTTKQAAKNQTTKKQSTRKQIAKKPAAKVQAAKEQAAKKQAGKEQAAKRLAAKRQGAKETGQKPSEKQAEQNTSMPKKSTDGESNLLRRVLDAASEMRSRLRARDTLKKPVWYR